MENLNSEIAARFKAVFDALNTNANEVSVKLGVANLKFYNVLSGKAKPGYETLHDFLKAYPRVNANYLLKGQLPILHTSSAQIVDVTKTEYIYLPLASAPVTNYASMSQNSNETYPVISLNRDLSEHSVIKLTDTSMAPRFMPGTLLLGRPVPAGDWDYLNSKLVAVLYRDTFVVRRIRENELMTKNYITLYADNPEAGFVHVKREDLQSIWQIIEIVGGGID